MYKKKRHLTLERLEARELKAGDIAANLVNGNLFLTEAAGQGGKDNSVDISQLSNGMVRVTGNATVDGSFSKVNGSTYQDFKVTGSLNVEFGAGNDLVVLAGKGLPPSFTTVNIDLSAPVIGNAPSSTVAATTVATKATVVTPPANPANPVVSDNDQVICWGVNVAGSMTINTGIGNDYVYVAAANLGAAGTGDLSINTGIGSDAVDIENLTGLVPGAITVQMNGLASDVDRVVVNGVYASGNIQVDTGAGNDFVNVQLTSSSATVDINTGAGNDSVTLENVHAVDQLMAQLGDGNDILNVDSIYSSRFDLDGGSGTNSLTTKNLGSAVTNGTYVLDEVGWTYINGRLVLGHLPVGDTLP